VNADDLARLRRCRLFRDVDQRLLGELLSRFACRIRSYPAGRLIHTRGEPYRNLLVLLEGSLSAEMHDLAGRTLHVETIAAPQAVASAVLFAPENLLPVSIRAARDVRLLSLPAEAVLALCERDSGFLLALLRDMGRRATFLAEKLRLTQFSTLRQKLASYLLERSRRAGTDRFDLTATRQELADVFGAARPSVSRVFGELAREGLLRLEGRRVEILDQPALSRLAADDASGGAPGDR